MIAAALACECPQTRLKQLRETGLGIGYGESSTGHKQRRADAKAMEEQIDEQVDHDAVKHLELLEYMLSAVPCSGEHGVFECTHVRSGG